MALTASALAAAVVGCAVAGALGQVAAARAGADGAADLAALAVAARVVRGEPAAAACALGGTVAAVPGLTMTGCRVDGELVMVAVRRDLVVLGARLSVGATARAGPVDP